MLRFLRTSKSRWRVCSLRFSVSKSIDIDFSRLLNDNGICNVPEDYSPQAITLLRRFDPFFVDCHDGDFPSPPFPQPLSVLAYDKDCTCAFVVGRAYRKENRYIDRSYGLIFNEEEYIICVERLPVGVYDVVTQEMELLEKQLSDVLERQGARRIKRTICDHFWLSFNSLFVAPLRWFTDEDRGIDTVVPSRDGSS